ncbi:hypothetical protein PLICRDRAFT_181267 [Plicaturopsis crispa FD-325 SS-3]|uniref:Uncharacterized protein n=1 Tax=Plicaturopsis crispa FD-325 SS-3 TaxID=944288 RepID=A0A0C9SUT1_PLICR|nr:hypothetical protein PLICRDRAFT_181267 [Plicaturopsis crispa FD-325 SS-3]
MHEECIPAISDAPRTPRHPSASPPSRSSTKPPTSTTATRQRAPSTRHPAGARHRHPLLCPVTPRHHPSHHTLPATSISAASAAHKAAQCAGKQGHAHSVARTGQQRRGEQAGNNEHQERRDWGSRATPPFADPHQRIGPDRARPALRLRVDRSHELPLPPSYHPRLVFDAGAHPSAAAVRRAHCALKPRPHTPSTLGRPTPRRATRPDVNYDVRVQRRVHGREDKVCKPSAPGVYTGHAPSMQLVEVDDDDDDDEF